ncbi:MAG: FHA domain-containing protein [Candidatus Obscuribacterales bacterium]|nr:FHA domain-containing protein [Candidatus Obscuribacterales bacterium]
MAIEQSDKTDKAEKVAPAHSPVEPVSADASRDSAKKEKERIAQTSGHLVQPMKIDGQSSTPEVTTSVTGKIISPEKAPEKPVDATAMEKTAIAIRQATGNENYIARWADKDAINNLLKDKTSAERKAIDDIYKIKYGVTLDQEMSFLSGADKDKFQNILHRKEGDIVSQDEGRIHAALLEHKNLIFGRSAQVLDKDIRDSLSTKRSDEIQTMDRQYKDKYGISLHDAISNDPNVSKETKKLVDFYWNGVDKRSDADTISTAKDALKSKDQDGFDEVMRGASQSARKAFRDQGGEQQIKDAFKSADYDPSTMAMAGEGALFASSMAQADADKRIQHSVDILNEGKISAASQIADNTGTFKWTTNSKGVESAIAGMTDSERALYLSGQKLSNGDKASTAGMNDQQKADASAYYDKIHTALVGAGNETSVKKWEDQIEHKDEHKDGLISKLAAHAGTLWNDSSGDIARDLENMDKSEWARLKPGNPAYDANYRQKIESMLKSYNCDDATLTRCGEILDRKQKADTFEEAQKHGHSGLLDSLNDNKHWYKDDTHSMLEAISKMTPDEQSRYRSDEDYRKQIDASVVDAFKSSTIQGRPEVLQSAQDMLARVSKGEEPKYDIVTNLQGYSTDFRVDHKQAVHDVENALKDKALRDRLTNPQTKEDKEYATKFGLAARAAIGDSDYNKYIKPILTDGRLGIENRLELNKGIITNDGQGAVKDILDASADELKKLKEDPAFREKAIGFLGGDDKAIAEKVIEQGRVNPEDEFRQGVVHWGGSAEIMDKLRALKEPEKDADARIDSIKSQYAGKYGSDLEADLLNKLSGDDKQEAMRILHNHQTQDEKFNDRRDEYYTSRDGIGSKIVENIGGAGTGFQLDDAMSSYRREIAESHKNFSEMTPEKSKELEDRFADSLKNFKESKSATADYVVDGTVAGAAIASMIVTGGADTPLLIAMAAGGAAMKVGAKSAIMGGDYNVDAFSVGMDCASGAVNGVTSVLGPGEVAAIFKVGETAALKAAAQTVAEVADQSVKVALKEGSTEALQKGTTEIMRHALSSGAKEIDQKAIGKLAESTVGEELTGQARKDAVEALSHSLSQNLNSELKKETEKWLVATGREAALNAGGGALGGGLGGGFEGVSQWDPKKSVAENLQMVAQAASLSAVSGGVMGGGMTVGAKVLGHSLSSARQLMKEAPEASEIINSTRRPFQYPVGEPAPAAAFHDSEAPQMVFDGGKTIFHTPREIEPPAATGEKVVFGGDTYRMAGMEPSGKYAVIRNDSLAAPVEQKVVSGGEFRRLYEKVDRAAGTTDKSYYVRDENGSMFRAYSLDKGDVRLDSIPTLKAVRLADIERLPVNGPDDVQVKFNGKAVHLEDGKFDLGRETLDASGAKFTSDRTVSAQHGQITFDRNEGKFFYQDTNSTNGSEIKKFGSTQWQPVPKGGKVEFEKGDQIRLAHLDDNIISLSGKPPKEFPTPDAAQIYVDNKPVELRDNKLVIGRAERANGQAMLDQPYVSSQHGVLRYDAKDGAFYYRDTSSLGTFIKKEGTPAFTRMKPGEEVRVGGKDQLRLGGDNGPEVKLVPFEERNRVQLGQTKDLTVSIDGNEFNLKNGPVEIGRNHSIGETGAEITDLRVSREHATMRWDAAQNSFVLADHSSFGTYIKREGSQAFERIKGTETKIGLNDEVHLGSMDGPVLKLNDTRGSSVVEDHQAFFNGRPLNLSGDSLEIGRHHQAFSNNAADALNNLVSNDHGTLKWNKEENSFYFTDHSFNGTYIKRADSDTFVRMRPDTPVKIGKYDQVRLGGEIGPELKLTQSRGDVLDDGRVRFKRADGNVIRNWDGSEIFSDGAGIKLERDGFGKVTSTTDPTGFRSDYSYDTRGRLTKVDFSNGDSWKRIDDQSWEIARANRSPRNEKLQVSVEPDGGLRIKDATGEHVHNVDGSQELHKPNGRIEYESADLTTEKRRLEAFSDRNFTNVNQKQRFDKLVQDFESRARTSGLDQNQMALTYHQINRLMKAGPDAPLSVAERVRLSEQLMHEAAYPQLIDQGSNPTCNVATVENRIFTRQPDKAAQLVVDVATTGKYTTADGTLIDLTRVPGALRPDAEANRAMQNSFDQMAMRDIKVDGKRNWAGQIFEQTAANVKWARTPELHMKPGDVLLYTKPEGKEVSRLMKYSVDSNGKFQWSQIKDSPEIKSPELTDIHNQITGGNDRDFVMVGPGRSAGNPGEAIQINSQAQFEQTLRDMQAKKNFPAVLMVDARNEPFKKWIGTDGHTSAWHVINIQDIHSDSSGRMLVDFTNQWGVGANHLGSNAVSARELFEASKVNANGAPNAAERSLSRPELEGVQAQPAENRLRDVGDPHASEVYERAATDTAPIRPQDKLDPERIQQVASEISQRLQDKPITSEQFSSIFEKMSPQDRDIAVELLEHSAGNMNSRALDSKLSALSKQMGGSKNITIYTLSGDTSGNPLAYLFRKNNPGLKIDIETLDAAAMKSLTTHPPVGQSLIFDDLSHASPAQKAFLSKQKDVTVADLGGFDKGMNLWDFGATKYAGPELLQGKLAELTGEVKSLMAANPQMSVSDAVEKASAGHALDAAKDILPDAKIVRPDFNSDKDLRAIALDSQKEVIDDLYREFTEPMISQEQIASFLGGIESRKQAAAAIILRDGTIVNNYSTMLDQMRGLQTKILNETGARPEDLIVVHSFDKDGSGYLVNGLYGKVNGLKSSQYMSLAEVKASEKGSLQGKVLVYLDDISYSGRQSAQNIAMNAADLKKTGAKVAVGTLGAFEVPADKNYWTKYQRSTAPEYQQLKRLNPTVVSTETYPTFYSPNNSNFAQAFQDDPALLFETGGQADWSKSAVDAAVILPYGGPNNNIDLVNELLKQASMPGT